MKFTCRKGHEWELTTEEFQKTDKIAVVCPHCGDEPAQLKEWRDDSWARIFRGAIVGSIALTVCTGALLSINGFLNLVAREERAKTLEIVALLGGCYGAIVGSIVRISIPHGIRNASILTSCLFAVFLILKFLPYNLLLFGYLTFFCEIFGFFIVPFLWTVAVESYFQKRRR